MAFKDLFVFLVKSSDENNQRVSCYYIYLYIYIYLLEAGLVAGADDSAVLCCC